jgi:hypothetical protein
VRSVAKLSAPRLSALDKRPRDSTLDSVRPAFSAAGSCASDMLRAGVLFASHMTRVAAPRVSRPASSTLLSSRRASMRDSSLGAG